LRKVRQESLEDAEQPRTQGGAGETVKKRETKSMQNLDRGGTGGSHTQGI